MPSSPAQAARPLCFGKRATIVGTPGPDRLVGTNRNDVIVTLGGRDEVDATEDDHDGIQRDRVCTGTGRDRIEYAWGRISGGPQRDVMEGVGGRVFGNGGNDKLDSAHEKVFGGPGDDYMYGRGKHVGGPGDDELISGIGVFDVAIGGPGNDRFWTYEGSDVFYVFDRISYENASGPIRVNLKKGTVFGEGRDRLMGPHHPTVSGSRFDDEAFSGRESVAGFSGDKGDDSFKSGSVGDGFSGGAGQDRGIGGGGDDSFSGGPGNDFLVGGRGRGDSISFNDVGGRVRVDLAKETAHGHGHDVIKGFEDIWGSDHRDRLLGDQLSNDIEGLGGSDILRGRKGNDEVDAWGGRGQSVFGNAGDDELSTSGDAGTVLNGGPGNDTCYGGGERHSCEAAYQQPTSNGRLRSLPHGHLGYGVAALLGLFPEP
jgi:Ca2+-binding RTX toxin-like protein